MTKITPIGAMQTYMAPAAAGKVQNSTNVSKPIFDGQPKADKPQVSDEPKPVAQYGKTKLPEGSKLIKEMTFNDNHHPFENKKVGIVRLPNGVEVSVVESPSGGKRGEISINKNGAVIFDCVEYTSIMGTDGDDNFIFKYNYVCNDPEKAFDSVIYTKRGNDRLVNPSASSMIDHKRGGYRGVTVVSDENLKIEGNSGLVGAYANGKLDTTESMGGMPVCMGSLDKFVPDEPQEIKAYGSTALPEGSKLKKEIIVYKNEQQKTAGVIELPNGMQITVLKAPSHKYSHGSISIDDNGAVHLDQVEFTYLIGTDNDDKFFLKNCSSLNDGTPVIGTMAINTRGGNDFIDNFKTFGNDVHVFSEGNLEIGRSIFAECYMSYRARGRVSGLPANVAPSTVHKQSSSDVKM